MIDHEHIVTLPSGTEIDVVSALGDLRRVREWMADELGRGPDGVDDTINGYLADLEHVAELVEYLAKGFMFTTDQFYEGKTVGELTSIAVGMEDLASNADDPVEAGEWELEAAKVYRLAEELEHDGRATL